MKNLLVDTSIWIEYFKGNNEVMDIIHDRNNFDIFITSPIITELILGLKTEQEKGNFTMCISAVPKLPIRTEDWVEVGYLGNTLRKKGITVPLPDLLVFHIARKNNCAVFTLDKHFQIIKNAAAPDFEIIQPGG